MQTNSIVVIAFDRISPFHLSVPCGVFGEDRRAAGVPKFEVLVCGFEKGSLTTSAGFSLTGIHGLRKAETAGMVIVPSWRDPREIPPPPLLEALVKAHERGAVIVGLCLGSYILAAAGLLDGRPATTHWAWADDLATRYPAVEVRREMLYVDDGDIVTSAGGAAGIDPEDPYAVNQWIAEEYGEPADLGRAGRVEEIGPVIAFLVSRRNSYMTGANVNVDGGSDFT